MIKKIFNGNNLLLMHKPRIIAIAIILLLSLSSIAAVALATPAQYPNTTMPARQTFTAVAASPSLVGLNQQVLINILTYPAPAGPTYYAQNLVGLQAGFENISCTITSPDGTKNTFMPVDIAIQHATGQATPGLAEIVGSLMFNYEPTMIGNYSVTASFPGQTYTTATQYANLNDTVYYQPSSSANIATFSVQQDTVLGGILNGYPWSPLPTGYWTNPVYTNNREWSAISGAWTYANYNSQGSNYNTYTTAPLSPHILWTNQIGSAGLVGGVFGSLPYNAASASGAIIMDGKIYQSDPLTSGNFQAVDLRTGQVLWSRPGSISKGEQEELNYQTATNVQEGGVSEWLWGTLTGNNGGSWVQYSPVNGAVTRNITGAPTDLTQVKNDNGSPIYYCVETNLAQWNTTNPLALNYVNIIKWDLSLLTSTNALGTGQTTVNTWKTGIVFNVSVTKLPGQVVNVGDGLGPQGPDVFVFPSAGANGALVVRSRNDMEIMVGLDATTGQITWVNNATAMELGTADQGIAAGPSGPMINVSPYAQWVAYDPLTGKEQWRASTGNLPWSLLPSTTYYMWNNDTFVGASYDGHVYAYNSITGKLVWQSDYVGNSTEAIYGNQPFNAKIVGGGGVIYASTYTTYSLEPRTRFHALYAIDEATGHFIWKLPIDIQSTALAYGYLVGCDSENGIQYGIGKGQTATILTAPMTSITSGTAALIQGTVMDQSPGQPNTAAISDSDMSTWMDYLHGQNATLINSPPSVHGVTVQLTAVDANGNSVDIGTATSDSSGTFATSFTPTTAGMYTIYATFAGSNSYYSSYGETHVTVAGASATSPTPIATSSSSISNSDVVTYFAIIAVVLIIAIAVSTVLLLRKK